MERPIQGVEAVDDGLDLGAEPKVIHGRAEDDHVGLLQFLAEDRGEVILMYTGAFHAAVVATQAGLDLTGGGIEAEHLMPRLLAAVSMKSRLSIIARSCTVMLDYLILFFSSHSFTRLSRLAWFALLIQRLEL